MFSLKIEGAVVARLPAYKSWTVAQAGFRPHSAAAPTVTIHPLLLLFVTPFPLFPSLFIEDGLLIQFCRKGQPGPLAECDSVRTGQDRINHQHVFMHYLPHTKARTPAHNSMQYSTILKSKTAPPSFHCNPMDMSGDQLIGSKLLSETKCCVCFLTSTVFLSWRLKAGRGLSVKSG